MQFMVQFAVLALLIVAGITALCLYLHSRWMRDATRLRESAEIRRRLAAQYGL